MVAIGRMPEHDERDQRVLDRLDKLANRCPRVMPALRVYQTFLRDGGLNRYEALFQCLEFLAEQLDAALLQPPHFELHTGPLPVPAHLGVQAESEVAVRARPVRRNPSSGSETAPTVPGEGAAGTSAPARSRKVEKRQEWPLSFGDPPPAENPVDEAFEELLGLPICVHTDGSGTTEDSPAGIGVVVDHLVPGERIAFGRFIGKGTNNVAELSAIEAALLYVTHKHRFRQVTIVSDSKYAIGALSGNKVNANVELIAQIKPLLVHFKDLRFQHVHGHSGIEPNELADLLAGEAVRRQGDVWLRQPLPKE